MKPEITRIELALPLKMGQVNCYLAAGESGFLLFDTGPVNGRWHLLAALADAGCRAGNLALVVLTHGDFDHSGNAAFLRQHYGARIAMNPHDVGMVKQGDMFWNRRQPHVLIRLIAPLAFRLGKGDRFEPDILLEDGDDLSPYGLGARVIHLPGHSLGSIGVRMAHEGALIGGDLLDNVKEPGLNSLMDDEEAARASVEKLAAQQIGMVYPGHGRPFALAQFLERYRAGLPPE